MAPPKQPRLTVPRTCLLVEAAPLLTGSATDRAGAIVGCRRTRNAAARRKPRDWQRLPRSSQRMS